MNSSPSQRPPFGEALRRLREAAGLTQEELAERAGLTPRAISSLERGERRRPYPHTVRALADALGLDEARRTALTISARNTSADGAAPPVPSGAAPTLPAPPTPLVGRERELAEVAELLRSGARLVTLMGPGGVGKTRLSQALAARLAGWFADGVTLVSLAGVAGADLVIPTVAQALGVRPGPGRAVPEMLRSYLSQRRMLLVLDNLEHVLDAAPEVAGLLGASEGLVVLATSRAPLRLRGEREYPVRPLVLPDLTRVPVVADVEENPAVRLFCERAAEASPEFRLTQSNAAAVAAVCRRLDGLPLALELAAARVRLLPPTALLARLDRALPLLTGGARDLPARQRTMRDTVSWSHDLLQESERVLFRSLAVFAGGWTAEAMEAMDAVGGGGLDALGALLDNSLIQVAADSRAEAEREPRFEMLETIREFALERLEASGEERAVRERHAAYYVALAQRARPELEGHGQAIWLERLGREHYNLRAALGYLLDQGRAEAVARLLWDTWLYWAVRGHAAEGQEWIARALSPGGLSAVTRVGALLAMAALLFVSGDAPGMSRLADEAAQAACGDDDGLARATMLRGYAATFSGDLDAGEALLLEALALSRGSGAVGLSARILNPLAQVALFRGALDRAMELLGEGEAALRAVGDAFTLAVNLNIQATVAQLQGDDGRTEALYRESLAVSAALRDSWTAAYGLIGLAGVAARRGNGERAARLFGAVEALREATGVEITFPPSRTRYESDLALVRTHVSREAMEAAWAAGRRMTLEEAAAEALVQPLRLLAELERQTEGEEAARLAGRRGHNGTAGTR